MRKNIARKCLCIALASAMMLGEAGTAMAASVENAADGRTAATVAAEEQADVAAANVSIWYAGAYKNSRTITINASGQAYRVEVWVNGVKCGEQYNGEDQQSFSINCEIPALLDSTYNAEVRAYDSNGEVTVQKVSPVKTDKVSFDGDPSVSVGYTVGSRSSMRFRERPSQVGHLPRSQREVNLTRQDLHILTALRRPELHIITDSGS